jgi:hypothetical protein
MIEVEHSTKSLPALYSTSRVDTPGLWNGSSYNPRVQVVALSALKPANADRKSELRPRMRNPASLPSATSAETWSEALVS